MSSGADCVIRMLEWGSGLLRRAEAVSEAEVRVLWRESGSMIINSEVKASGIAGLVDHFEELRRKLRRVEAQLPPMLLVEHGDMVAARYILDVEHLDGARDRIHVGAFFEMREGRIEVMNEVVAFEQRHVALDAHS